MTLYLVQGGRYHRRMASLPFPARRLTLSEINADYRKYLGELEQGGAILVVSDDEQAFLGVLTRDPRGARRRPASAAGANCASAGTLAVSRHCEWSIEASAAGCCVGWT